MSLSLRSFLQILKSKPIISNTVRIVCGNESADLDSVTSALSYAYFNYVVNPSNSNHMIPIINIPKEDLKLRRDIVHVLNDVNISDDLLFFIEDVKHWTESDKTIEAVLVDHNVVVNEAKKYITKVVGVIDHHKDMGLYPDVVPRIIQICGSCSSLVFKYWMKNILPKDYVPSTDVTTICMAAALVDTTNFQHRVEQPDLDVEVMYSKLLPSIQRDKYTKQIKASKNDITGFTIRDLLRKDYKQFEFINHNVNSGKLLVGISSVVKSIEWFYNEFNGKNTFKNECIKYRDEKHIDILAVMTAFVEHGSFKRQLVMIPTKDMEHISQHMIGTVSEQLDLEDTTTVASDSSDSDANGYYHYEQKNIEASRKQVTPYLQKAFEDMKQ